MATIKNLMIKLGLDAERVDAGVNKTTRGLDRVARQADGVEKQLKSLGDRFDGVGSTASRLAAALGGFVGQLGSAGVSLVTSAAQMAILSSAMASATTSAVGLVSALAPAAGILAALPAALVLTRAALGTLKLALVGVADAWAAAMSGDAMAFQESLVKLAPAAREVAQELWGLAPGLREIQQAVQQAFFSQLVGHLEGWADVLAPLEEGATRAASGLGRLAEEVLELGRDVGTADLIEKSFATLSRIIADLDSFTLDQLLGALMRFVTATLPAFDGLGASLNRLMERSIDWLNLVTSSGRALGWIESAVAVFKQLGAIVADVGGILAGVFRAIQSSGPGALGVLGGLLDGVHAFVDSAKGQDALVAIFTALGDVGQALVPVIKAMASGIGEVAPTIAELATLIGPILTDAVTALVPALKALGPGVIAVFGALGEAVSTLASSGALTRVAEALADILIAVAPLMPALADLLVPILQVLAQLVTAYVAPALETLVGWVRQAVDWLSGGGLTGDSWLARVARTIWEEAVPIFERAGELIGKVFASLTAWVHDNRSKIEEWGNRIIEIIQMVGDIVSGVFQFLSIAWEHFGGPLLDRIGDVFDAALRIIHGAMTAIKGVVDLVLGLMTGDWQRALNGLKAIFTGVWDAIVGVVQLAVGLLRAQFVAVEKFVTELWSRLWGGVRGTVESTWNTIVGWVTGRVSDVRSAIGRLAEIPGQVSGWFGRVKDSIADRLTEAVAFVRSVPGRIVSALGDLGGLLYNAGRSMIQGLINGLYSMLQNVLNAAGDILGRIRAFFPFSPAKVGPFSGQGWTLFSGRSLAEGFATGLLQRAGMVTSAMEQVLGGLPALATPGGMGAAGFAAAASAAPSGGGRVGNHYSITVNVPVSASPADVGAAIVRHIEEHERRSGPGWRAPT